MNVLELKQILSDYDDEAIVQIAVADHAQVINLQSIGVDEEYDTDDALVLTVFLDEESDNLYFDRDTCDEEPKLHSLAITAVKVSQNQLMLTDEAYALSVYQQCNKGLKYGRICRYGY